MSIKPGQRTQDAELKISLRSSQGSQHTLTLPENAVLQSVAIDGQTQPIRPQGRKLTLPVNPGKQEVLDKLAGSKSYRHGGNNALG